MQGLVEEHNPGCKPLDHQGILFNPYAILINTLTLSWLNLMFLYPRPPGMLTLKGLSILGHIDVRGVSPAENPLYDPEQNAFI